MKETGLFNEATLQKMQKTRKIFLKFAVWILIAELAFGAVLILTGSWDIAIGRIQGTFLILAVILFVSVNNFIRIEKGDRAIQIFALIGFVSNLIWGVFAFLLMWEIAPYHWTESFGGSYRISIHHMTFYAKTMLISAYAAMGGFWISNVMAIEETIKLVKPLKITAIACIVYLWFFETIITPIEPGFKDVEKLYQLAGLAGLAFVITALAALIISRTNAKKNVEANTITPAMDAQPTPRTVDELRAEIEEKIRREILEKELRAKIEAEQASAGDVERENAPQENNPDDTLPNEYN